MGRYFFIHLVLLYGLFCSCSEIKGPSDPLFRDIATTAGIDFSNNLTFTAELNPYTFRNFFNGGGVAIADINNDGLADIYFSGNQVDNKLYLNQGNLTFKDITKEAGLECSGVWSTGVTFADVNADGWMDLYVCKSGPPGGANRHNELFINNGDLTFTDKSKEFGLDVTGLSVHAGFFDYDLDGDLDCYLLTNSIKSIGNFDLIPDQRKIPDPNLSGNKLFRNDNGRFTDVTAAAGIYHSAIGYGLGITFGDFNEDHWPDIFISNDFFERDYLYLNNQNGTFSESLTDLLPSISMGSMGADFADLDNDGTGELFVTEMLPENLNRRKTKTVFQTWNQYLLQEEAGYHRQFSRNVLQKKIADNQFAEVGRLAGVAATEWSWSALMCDLDNDGYKDIFVANGIYKDLLDRDYLNYSSQDINLQAMRQNPEMEITNLVNSMPVSTFSNYAFHNQGDLSFANKSKEWGLEASSYSCGSAYGDLDNDGDLDLVVNNINSRAGVFINQTDSTYFKSIAFELSGPTQNPQAIGARIEIWHNGVHQVGDHFTTRGFQSSVQPGLRFGIGGDKKIDSVKIIWPDRTFSSLYNVPANRIHRFKYNEQSRKPLPAPKPKEQTSFQLKPIHQNYFIHNGNQLNDFDRDRMLPWMYTTETPALITGDINNDGSEDLYITGGKNQHGAFFDLREPDPRKNNFQIQDMPDLPEETAGTFFDADGDGDQDFYLGTGGRSFSASSSALQDRLFLNNGLGHFSPAPSGLPFDMYPVTSCIVHADFDRDGDTDLFVGERFHPSRYGTGGKGHLLMNSGQATFANESSNLCPELNQIGMVTDAVATDVDGDGWTDVVVVGDWTDVLVIKNKQGKKFIIEKIIPEEDNRGWWNVIKTADLNQDGRPDFIVGNHGTNTFFKPGDRMYLGDVDGNGSTEHFFTTKVGNDYYPVADRDEILSQVPSLKKSIMYYKDFAVMPIAQFFTEKNPSYLEIKELRSVLFLSEGQKFRKVPLPLQARFDPIYALHISDLDGDGIEDILTGGNLYKVKPEFGRFDASSGWFFKGQLGLNGYSLTEGISLGIKGQIRDIKEITAQGKKLIFFAKHEAELEIVEIHP